MTTLEMKALSSTRIAKAAITASGWENDIIKLTTDKETFYVKPRIIDDKAKIGISVANNVKIVNGLPGFLLPMLTWFNMFFYWLWIINLGIGLFNLLPLGPIDGGRMLQVSLLSITNNKKASIIFKTVTIISLSLIIINLLPWFIKLFMWFFGLFS